DLLFAIDEAAAEGALALVANDDDLGAWALEAVLQVVDDASAARHAGAGDDDHGALHVVQALGFFAGAEELEGGEVQRGLTIAQHLAGFFIEELAVAAVQLGGFDAHGAVDIDGHGIELAGAVEPGHFVDQVLRAADGEGGDQDLALLAAAACEDAVKL